MIEEDDKMLQPEFRSSSFGLLVPVRSVSADVVLDPSDYVVERKILKGVFY